MTTQEQIQAYITTQVEPKRSDLQALHQLIQQLMPHSKVWFLDGKNGEYKTVTNPSIGYGSRIITYADGKTKEFYQLGISGNTTGLSVYILGMEDKQYLAQRFGETIGKAKVSGYCIKFKRLADIHMDTLEAAIRSGIEMTSED